MFGYVTRTPWKHFRMHQVRQQQDKEGRRGRNTTLLQPPNGPAFWHYVHFSFPYRTGVGIYSVVGGFKEKKRVTRKWGHHKSVSGLKPSSLKTASTRPQRPPRASGWSQEQLCRADWQASNSSVLLLTEPTSNQCRLAENCASPANSSPSYSKDETFLKGNLCLCFSFPKAALFITILFLTFLASGSHPSERKEARVRRESSRPACGAWSM